jgi:ferric iron reductase protein FhuF
MKVQIELNDELLDEAFQKNLEWHLTHINKELMRLRGKKKLENYELEDKEYVEKLYPALKIVGDYFGVETDDKKRNKRVYR